MKARQLLNKMDAKNDNGSYTDKNSPQYKGPIDYMDAKIAQYYSPKLVINDMFNENQNKDFTSVLLIGTPGTGKTTLARFIAHSLHSKGNYAVKWYGKNEIVQLDKVLQDLPARDTILVFDDVSMAIKRIKDPQKRLDVLEALTTARHPAFGEDRKIFTIANIHYMFALEKIWRDQGSWKIFTDLQGEELGNFNQYTRNRYDWQANTFSKITLDEFRKGYFDLTLTNGGEMERYTTDKPFRFAMVHDGARLRFMLYPKMQCKECATSEANKKPKILADPLVDIMFSKYGRDGTLALKMLAFQKGKREQFRKPLLYALDDAAKMDGIADIDYQKLAESLRAKSGIKPKRDYRHVDDQKHLIEEIFAKSNELKENRL